jgi:uncharacterized protein
MKIAPGEIGFDIDGVVADTMEAFIRLAARDFSILVRPEQITDFMVEKCLDMDPRVIENIFGRLMKSPLKEGLQPISNALSVLHDLAEQAPLTFITARPDPAPIAAWLAKHLGRQIFSRARLVATGDHDGKVAHIRELGLRYFIDDRPQTCRQLAAEADITPIVFSQPWNRGRHSLPSVKNWEEVRHLCLAS